MTADTLNLDHTLACGQLFRWRREADGSWTGVVADRVIRLRRAGPELIAQGYPTPVSDDWLCEYFRLGVDLPALYSDWSRVDAHIARAIACFPGLRIVRQSPAECLLSYVCSTANAIPRIAAAIDRLAALLGEPVACLDGMSYYTFPAVSHIAVADPSVLAEATGLEWRATRLVAVAASLAVQPVSWLEDLREAEYHAARAALTTLPGVGPKIADCVCLFASGKDEAVPVDTHVWQLAGRLFMPDLRPRRLTPATYARVADLFRQRYGPYAGWAQEYLFYEDLLRSREGTLL